MSEAIQKRRRADRAKDWLAGFAASLALALSLAAAIDLLASALGGAMGDANWHRGWVEIQFNKSLEWLQGTPIIGPVASLLVDPQRGWLPRPGALRDIFVLALLFFAPCGWLGTRVGPTLIARYDDEALRTSPPAELGLHWAGPLGTVQTRAWDDLMRWCRAGMGNGSTPFFRPFSLPDVPERFSLAVMVGENGGGKSHLAEAFGRELDRSDELGILNSQSKLKGWRLKLSVKWHELWWWRDRHARQPWDCGYLVEDPAAGARLAQFRPRRPTLIVADELREGTLESAIKALGAGRVEFRHPVRLLVVDVALPGQLGLRFDPISRQWRTPAHDLGIVTLVDFTGARFQVAQMRAIIGAQPPQADGTTLRLMGGDAEWAPVTAALDEQPILIAEALRWVREKGRRYEDLLAPDEIPHLSERLAGRQNDRSTPSLAPDPLGKSRELLRERILRDRARHRSEGLRQALGAQAGDPAFNALMLATVACGGSAARLHGLLGLPVNPLTHQRLESAFGNSLPMDWVPPIRPAIVADELLRLHFGIPLGAPLGPDAHEQVRKFLRNAWLLNPKGTASTVARWRKRRQQDAFSLAMQQLPMPADLCIGLDKSLRVNLVRTFVEMVVFHDGEVQQAQAALQALQPDDLPDAYDKLTAVFLNPKAAGVPALLLWLDMQRLNFPRAVSFDSSEAEALVVRLATEALQLLRQCVVVSVPVDSTLEAMLDQAAFAVLPMLAKLEGNWAFSPMVAQLASELLDRREIGEGVDGAIGQANRLRLRIRIGLLVGLVQARADGHALPNWPGWVQVALGRFDVAGTVPTLEAFIAQACGPDSSTKAVARGLLFWCWSHMDDPMQMTAGANYLVEYADGLSEDADVQFAAAQALNLLWWVHHRTSAEATTQAAERLDDIVARFGRHEGIQHEAARAWRLRAWVHSKTDAQSTRKAAQKVIDIAARFEQHEGVQHEAAAAWRHIACAHKDTNAQATAEAAQNAASIAARFEQHEGIQYEAARAWCYLSWAHKDIDVRATEQAVQCVADIAAHFEQHEGIQDVAAQAWCHFAFAQQNSDIEATARAINQVEYIAGRFQQHEGIHLQAAQGWRHLAWAHKDTNTEGTVRAAQKVADIAARFEQHEGIQAEAAEALTYVAWNCMGIDACATARAAQRVAEFAARFERHEGIQQSAAFAWNFLAWAHKDTDAKATAQAALKVGDIAARFESSQSIQYIAASAWRILTWAHKDSDIEATAQAAQKVADIAARFVQHEGIQDAAAEAWRNVSSALAGTDAQATEQSAQKVTAIAARFKHHEGICSSAAFAWANAVLAAVKFDNASLVARAVQELDNLAGTGRRLPQWSTDLMPASGRIIEQRVRAQIAVDAWIARGGGRSRQ